jgi:hypothetical protein
VCWRRIDLKRVVAERYDVDFQTDAGEAELLQQLPDIAWMPRRPAQDERIVEAFKNVWPAPFARGLLMRSAADQSASTYPASEGPLRAEMEIRALRSS